jgi:hypothetical protein
MVAGDESAQGEHRAAFHCGGEIAVNLPGSIDLAMRKPAGRPTG